MLKETIGASRLMFGTDYPLRYEDAVTESIAEFLNYPGFNKTEKQEIMSGTAKELL